MSAQIKQFQRKNSESFLPSNVEAGIHKGNRPYLVYGEHDEKTLGQFFNALSHDLAVSGVLCADGHFGYGQPIGSAIQYNGVSVSGVGYDIGCGVSVRTMNISYEEILDVIPEMQDLLKEVRIKEGDPEELKKYYPYGLGQTDLFTRREFFGFFKEVNELAKTGFSSLGGGNHFFNLGYNVDGNFSIVCHTGSRSYGHKISQLIYDHYGYKDSDTDPLVIPRNDELFSPYFSSMSAARNYASYNRDSLTNSFIEKIRTIYSERKGIKKGDMDQPINHYTSNTQSVHNVALVGAVGTTISYKGCVCGTHGVVASSMADPVYLVKNEGIPSRFSYGTKSSPAAIPHGAGRLYSRNRARKELSVEDQKKILEERGVTLIGGGVDESPEAYRDVHQVLRDHSLTMYDAITPKMVLME